MSQDLVIHLSGPDAFDWSVVERSSGQRVASGTAQFDALPEALPVEGVDRTLLLLPAERIFATRLELPARSEREARQAAPFMIEDELAARLDQTRIVTGSKDEDGKRWVFAAETAWIDGVMEALGTSLVRPVHILPDAMAASEADAALTLADRSGDVLFWFAPQVRDTAQSMGGAVDAGFFNHVAHALVAGAKGGEVVVSPALGLAGPGFKSITFDPLDLRASRWTNERLGLLPALGGDGWRSSLNWGELLRPIRRGAIMAAALAITLAGLMLAEGFYYRFQAERFDTASVAVFRNVVPEMTRRVIPAEAERLLRERIGGGWRRGVLFPATHSGPGGTDRWKRARPHRPHPVRPVAWRAAGVRALYGFCRFRCSQRRGGADGYQSAGRGRSRRR